MGGRARTAGAPRPPRFDRCSRDVPADTPLIAVCRSGGRSSRAVAALSARGLEAHNLTGGMQAWAEAGLPVANARGGHGTVD